MILNDREVNIIQHKLRHECPDTYGFQSGDELITEFIGEGFTEQGAAELASKCLTLGIGDYQTHSPRMESLFKQIRG